MVPEGASFAILLRHAEREALDNGDIGENCPLTPKGLCGARDFGACIAESSINNVYSSPSLRCVDTAKTILLGAGIDRTDVIVRKKLGDPEIYINNPVSAALAFKKYGNAGVVEQYITNGGLAGFATSCGRRQFMSDIYTDLAQAGSHNIYVSHDLLLIPLIAHMTGEKFRFR